MASKRPLHISLHREPTRRYFPKAARCYTLNWKDARCYTLLHSDMKSLKVIYSVTHFLSKAVSRVLLRWDSGDKNIWCGLTEWNPHNIFPKSGGCILSQSSCRSGPRAWCTELYKLLPPKRAEPSWPSSAHCPWHPARPFSNLQQPADHEPNIGFAPPPVSTFMKIFSIPSWWYFNAARDISIFLYEPENFNIAGFWRL